MINVQNTGQPFPPIILNMMEYIREKGLNTEGLFRVAGNAARVMVLEETIDRNPGTCVHAHFPLD